MILTNIIRKLMIGDGWLEGRESAGRSVLPHCRVNTVRFFDSKKDMTPADLAGSSRSKACVLSSIPAAGQIIPSKYSSLNQFRIKSQAIYSKGNSNQMIFASSK